MKRQILKTAATAIIVALASTGVVLADQRPRNPGAAGGSSSGGSSGGGGGDTGRVASPRGGGGSTWGGSSGSSGRSTASTPASAPTTRSRRGGGESGGAAVPSYSRPRDGAPVTGRAIPRSSVGTLPPIISGPIYWGNDSWYFYPWGYGAMG